MTCSHVVTPDSLLLFEILDDPPSLSFRVSAEQTDRVDVAKKYHKLAWAFLLPVGQSGEYRQIESRPYIRQ